MTAKVLDGFVTAQRGDVLAMTSYLLRESSLPDASGKKVIASGVRFADTATAAPVDSPMAFP
jgi:hypothetical protein